MGLLCQGMVTEKQYFDRLKELLNWSHVQIVHQKTAKDPKGLLAEAKKKSQLDGGWDVVFLVVDVDNDPLAKLREVCQKCRAASKGKTKYYLVVTNPCFEMWLKWHFGREHNHQDLSMLQNFLTKKQMLVSLNRTSKRRTKHISTDFPIDRYQEATKNAVSVALNQVGENPSTSIGAMIEKIIRLGDWQ